jgi:Electron transfer DM13
LGFSVNVFRRYQGDNITIALPDNLTVYDIDWLAVWSPRDEQNLGHVMIEGIRDVPMALGQNTIPCRSGSSSARIAFLLVPFSLFLCILELQTFPIAR